MGQLMDRLRRSPTAALVTHGGLRDLAPDDRLLAAALSSRGVDVAPAVWDDPGIRWSSFDIVLLRSCWDYHLKARAFSSWLGRLAAAGIEVWNPVRTVRWNIHKRYLRELYATGADGPETLWIGRGEGGDALRAPAERGWKKIVVKPCISATAHRTYLLDGEDAARCERLARELAADGDVLIQEFLPEVVEAGEWSLCFVAGALSHAVLKRPGNGDFRVQGEFGGTVESAQAPPAARKAAQRLLERLELPWLYARVDGVLREERFLLLELELIEPSLFLDTSADAASRLADAIMEEMAGRVAPRGTE